MFKRHFFEFHFEILLPSASMSPVFDGISAEKFLMLLFCSAQPHRPYQTRVTSPGPIGDLSECALSEAFAIAPWRDALETAPLRMARQDARRMIVRRELAAGIVTKLGCHTFRATGITVY